MAALTKKLIKSALPELFVGKYILINCERVELKNVTFSDTQGDNDVKISACVYAHIKQSVDSQITATDRATVISKPIKSSKVVEFYAGTDSFGRRVQVAKSDNGNYYSRIAEYNGYAVAFGKWEKEAPVFSEDGRMEWGFNYLTKYNDVSDCNYRLPLDLDAKIAANDDTETFEVEQELAECDELIRASSISRKITYATGAWIEIDYVANIATVSDPENADLVELARLILMGFEECNKAVELQSKFTKTVSYIARPQDSRCSWWCVQVPEDQRLDGTRINAPFLKRGADLELKSGDMLIDSEANHHRKNRGYSVVLIVCDGEKIQHLHPMAQRKAFIKAHGGQDLMHESGDVNGCVRMAVWLRRQPDFKVAVSQLLEC